MQIQGYFLLLAGLGCAAQAGPVYVLSSDPAKIAVLDPTTFKLAGTASSLPEGLSATACSQGTSFESQGARYSARPFRGHGLVTRLDLSSNSTTAMLEIPGNPLLALYLPPEEGGAGGILVASEAGVLYRLNLDLTGTVQALSMEGEPQAFCRAPLPTASPTPMAQATSSPTPAASQASSPLAVLQGALSGRLLDAQSHAALTGLSATVTVLNRRGKSYVASLDAQGNWRVDGLPWGAYSIVVQAQGFQKLVHLRALLAGTKEENLDLELSKE